MEPNNKANISKEYIVLNDDVFDQELLRLNEQLEFKHPEVERKFKEIIYINKELHYKYKEVGLAAELILVNKELAFQYEEKEKRAAELILANIELAFQNKEKIKRTSELIIANKELVFHNVEKEKRVLELIIANRELAFQKLETNIRESELLVANRNLVKLEQKQKEYVEGLEEMMFMTSHQVRQPIANILGFSNVLDQLMNSPEELKQAITYIKEATLKLDLFTRDLSSFICELRQREGSQLE